MAFKPPVAQCRLCCNVAQMSREHIPPASTYETDSMRVRVQGFDDYVENRKGRTYQSGFLSYVICEECNKRMGSWYGVEYARWCEWGHQSLRAMQQAPHPVVPPFDGYLARIGKQVLATMIAASQPALTSRWPNLRSLVLDREAIASSRSVRLSLYLCPTSTGRSTGLAVALRKGSEEHVLVEFALRPFGWVLTLEGEPFDSRPVDVSHFLELGVDERITVPSQHLPVLPTHEPLPGDYRTRNEIRRDMIQNIFDEEDDPNSKDHAKQIMDQGLGQAFLEARGEEW